MRFLKVLIGVVLLLAVVLYGGALMLPAGFTVVREVQVAAPPEKAYALVDDPRQWKRWTVWNRRDPAMKITYEGPPSGTGAVWAWKSLSEGDGRMTFTAAEPPRRLAYDLYFPDFDATSKGDLVFEPVGGGTRVRWTMHGNMGSSLPLRWVALFADRMVGPDFEAGLANLKAEAEKG